MQKSYHTSSSREREIPLTAVLRGFFMVTGSREFFAILPVGQREVGVSLLKRQGRIW